MALALKMQDALIFQVRHFSAFLENNLNNYFIYKESSIIKLSKDVYIHFAVEQEIGKTVILIHAETLRYNLKRWNESRNVSSYLAGQFSLILIATRVFLLTQEVKMQWKSGKILSWDIWVLKFSCDRIIKTIGLILR